MKERVAYIPRGATVAWGPTAQTSGMIAAGTVGASFDPSFDASASLEIFQMDLGSKTGKMELQGSVQTSERFHRIAWGTAGVSNGSLAYGMLAGGMVDGTVKVFNPAVITGYVALTAPWTPMMPAAVLRYSTPYRPARYLVLRTFDRRLSSALLVVCKQASKGRGAAGKLREAHWRGACARVQSRHAAFTRIGRWRVRSADP